MASEVALVTGATKGIGLAISQRLKSAGYHVVGIARTSPSEFAGDLVHCDMHDRQALGETLAKIVAQYEIRHLVNNFGRVERASVEDVSYDHFRALIDANLFTAIQCVQAVLPHMRSAQSGRIVNLASRAMLGRAGSSIYACAKAAIVGFSRSLALELAREGITVNVIAPGTTDTDGFRNSNPPGGSASGTQAVDWSSIVPLQRIGEPREIAAAVQYLLSDDASYTTGQVVYVCGGLSVGTNLI